MEDINEFKVNTIPSDIPHNGGIGYVIVPKDIDIDEYINHCKASHTISMNAGFANSIFHNVKVSESAIQKIKFPKDYTTNGSAVVWLKMAISNLPLVIDTVKYENEYFYSEDESFRINRSYNGNVIDIYGKSKSASLDVNIVSDEKNSGELNINVRNKSTKAKLNVYVEGSMILHSKKQTILVSDNLIQMSVIDKKGNIKGMIQYKIGSGFLLKDEFGNEQQMNEENIKFIPKNIVNISEGSEPSVLGDTLEDLLKQLCDIASRMSTECSKITVSTPMGPSSVPANTAVFVQYAADLQTIQNQFLNFKSKKLHID